MLLCISSGLKMYFGFTSFEVRYSVVDQEFHSSGTAVVLLYGLSVWNAFWRQQVGLGDESASRSGE
jgi:hypothetical protein